MRLLICGGRDFYGENFKYQEILDALEALTPVPELVITGEASGVDTVAREWAALRGIPCMVFPAAWQALGKAAGPIRNGWMLAYGNPDMILAFPGGVGTASMVKLASGAGVKVVMAREAGR